MTEPSEIVAELRKWATREPSLPGRNPEDEELWLEGFTDARNEVAEIIWRDCPRDEEHPQPESTADYLELIRETLETWQYTMAPSDAVRAALQLVRQALAVEEREAFYGAQKAAQGSSLPKAVTWLEIQNTVACPQCGRAEGEACQTITGWSVHETRISAYKEYKEYKEYWEEIR